MCIQKKVLFMKNKNFYHKEIKMHFFLLYRFMEKLEIDSLEELLERREPLNGKEFRSVLHKTSRLLIDANGHLEGGSRHYHSLFEK